MKKFIILWILAIIYGVMGSIETYSSHPNYVTVAPPIVKIRNAPSENATVLFTSNQSIIFEVLESTNNFYLIPLLNGFNGWIAHKDVKKYRGSIPPPPYRMGISHPISEEKLQKLKEENTLNKTDVPQTPSKFRYPEIPQNLNLDINGFFESRWSFRDFGDGKGGNISVNDPRWDIILNDPVYKKIPNDILRGNPQLRLRYRLNIEGEVDKDLNVKYNLEQEPDLPGRYDINVNYKNTQLTFFHYDESFEDGQFITVKKALNGVRGKIKTDDWEAKVATGKQRSEAQIKTFIGNGQQTYSLGNTSILKGSLTVFLNNRKLKENKDYTADYFKGEIKFKIAPQKTDNIRVIYEFTNPIEDFIPALSRKNFLGAQFKWSPKPIEEQKKIHTKLKETLWPTDAQSPTSSKIFFLKKSPIMLGSEKIQLNKQELKRNKDYFIQNLKGKIEIKNITLTETDHLEIDYLAYKTNSKSETFIGKDSPGPYNFQHPFIIRSTSKVTVDGRLMQEGLDYNINYQDGSITFEYPIKYPYTINTTYNYIESEKIMPDEEERPLKLGVTYINESVRSEEQNLKLTQTEIVSPNSFNEVQLSQHPLLVDEEILATIKNGVVSENSLEEAFPNLGSTISNSLISAGYLTNDKVLTDQYQNFDTTFKNSLNGISSLSEIDKENIFDILGTARNQAIDVKIINAYTGLIELESDHFETIEKATITYKYQKSFNTRFPFLVPETLDQERQYINDGSQEFRINNIPIKYNGISEIRYFVNGNELTYTELRPGKEFDVDYQSNNPENPGEEIIITFFKTGDRIESENLPNYPKQGERLILIYDYAPGTSPNQGKLSQTMIGVTLENKLNDQWSVSAELVGAQNNFEKPQINEEVTLTPSGANNENFNLGKTNIIEDSESVYVENANGITQLSKNIDYIINYIIGTIRFTEDPGVNDKIRVSFQYEDNSNTTQGGQVTPFKFAGNIGTQFKNEDLDTSLHFKTIDKNFLPISPINDRKGSSILEGYLNYKFNENNRMLVDYAHRNTFVKEDTSGKDIYEKQHDISLSSEMLLVDTFKTKITARYFEEVQDKTISQNNPSKNTHAVDNKITSIQSETQFGDEDFNHFISYNHIKNTRDFKDLTNKTDSIIDSVQINTKINLKNIFLINNLRLSPHYSLSQEKVNSNTTTSPYTTRKNYGFSSYLAPFSTLKIDSNFDIGSIKSQAASSTENLTILKNQKNRVSFTPYHWINTSYEFERRESESPYIGQTGKISKTQSYNINKYLPYQMLTWAGLPKDTFFTKPFKKSFLTFNQSFRDNSENDGRRIFDKDSINYSFNRFSPFPGFSLDKISYLENKSLTFTNISNTTTSTNSTLRDYNQLTGVFKYKPQLPILNLFTLSKSFDQKKEERIITRLAYSGTDNISIEEAPETNEKLTIRFKATPLIRELNRLTQIDLGPMEFNYNEQTQSLSTSRNTTSSANNSNTTPFTSRIADIQQKQNKTLSGRISPFNLADFSFSVASRNEVFIRNLNQSTEGSTFKDILDGNIQTGFSFIPGINMVHSYTHNELFQLRSPTINISRSQIQNAIGKETITEGTNQLTNTIQTATTKWTFAPLPKLNVNLGATYKKINQSFTTATDSIQEMTQKIGSLGATYYPYKDFSLSYQVNIKFNQSYNTDTQSQTENSGNTRIFKAQYTLFNQKNIQVNLDYDRTDTEGQDLNTLENTLSEQGSGNTLRLEIMEQKNTIQNGSLSINIKIPFKDSPYIDDLVITASGYIKKISDQFNANNNYDITGLILRGTLNF